MPILVDLEGVKRGRRVPCKMVRSVSAALKVTHATATVAASDNGSISVWIGDDGKYRTSFHRYLSTLSGPNEFTSKAKLREWLKEWWPRMERSQIPV